MADCKISICRTALLIGSLLVAAPAAAAGPTVTLQSSPGIDGSQIIPAGGPATTLFGGKVPPNGFTIQVYGSSPQCIINDNGPAGVGNGGPTGFVIPAGVGFPIFTTPPGYAPMGPVTIYCTTSVSVEARGW